MAQPKYSRIEPTHFDSDVEIYGGSNILINDILIVQVWSSSHDWFAGYGPNKEKNRLKYSPLIVTVMLRVLLHGPLSYVSCNNWLNRSVYPGQKFKNWNFSGTFPFETWSFVSWPCKIWQNSFRCSKEIVLLHFSTWYLIWVWDFIVNIGADTDQGLNWGIMWKMLNPILLILHFNHCWVDELLTSQSYEVW